MHEERGDYLVEVPIIGPIENGLQSMGMAKANEQIEGMRKWRKPINASPSWARAYPNCDPQVESSKKKTHARSRALAMPWVLMKQFREKTM